MPYFDQEFGEELDRLFSEKFDLLLGRKTYEIFAAYWPYYDEDAPHGGIAKLFKEIKKYAVSRSGGVDPSWQGSVPLRDIADVKRLKQEDGPNLVTQGSTELVHALLANDLVDAMSIFTVPVVLGGGKKLFADGSTPHSIKLTSSRVSSTGIGDRLLWRENGHSRTGRRAVLRTETVSIPFGDITLAGTLTLPRGRGPHPAVVLLHGGDSGERRHAGTVLRFLNSLKFTSGRPQRSATRDICGSAARGALLCKQSPRSYSCGGTSHVFCEPQEYSHFGDERGVGP